MFDFLFLNRGIPVQNVFMYIKQKKKKKKKKKPGIGHYSVIVIVSLVAK